MKWHICTITILFTIISGDCGLVVNLFGAVNNKVEKVKEDVHHIINQTVNAFGKERHKIHEGLHRKEDTKINPSNHIESLSTTTVVNLADSFKTTSRPYDATLQNKEENGNDKDSNQEHSTTSLRTSTIGTTESYNDKNIAELNNTNHSSTTKSPPWIDGIKLENILPAIMHNDTHIKNTNTFNGETGSFETNYDKHENEIVTDETKEEAKNSTKTSGDDDDDENIISDQIVFAENKNELKLLKNKQCPSGLVRTANGACLEQRQIHFKKPNKMNVFGADCPSGKARALDGSCQKVIGPSEPTIWA